MTRRTKQVVVIGALAAALAIGGGAAVAGGGLGFGDDQQAFLNDAAKRLNVTPAELKAALQGAYGDRLDAAVAAGKITKEQAEAMKQRSAQGGLPLFGGGHRGGFGHHGPASLAAAATYLGLTEAELRTAARVGQVARRGREGGGQVGRRPREGARGRGEDEARRGREGRQADAGPGRRAAGAADRAPGRPRQRDRRSPRWHGWPPHGRPRHGRPGRAHAPAAFAPAGSPA